MKMRFVSQKLPGARPNCRFSIFNCQFSVVRTSSCERRGPRQAPHHGAYLLTEALVYIGLVFVLLVVAYAAMYRFIDKSVILRRNTEDISRAMHAGERWRADIRAAVRGIRLETNTPSPIIQLATAHGEVSYTMGQETVWRRVSPGAWVPLLKDVKASSMQMDARPHVNGWRWELELLPRTKGSIKPGRVRPLFTFLAVPQIGPTP